MKMQKTTKKNDLPSDQAGFGGVAGRDGGSTRQVSSPGTDGDVEAKGKKLWTSGKVGTWNV